MVGAVTARAIASLRTRAFTSMAPPRVALPSGSSHRRRDRSTLAAPSHDSRLAGATLAHEPGHHVEPRRPEPGPPGPGTAAAAPAACGDARTTHHLAPRARPDGDAALRLRRRARDGPGAGRGQDVLAALTRTGSKARVSAST